MDEAEAIQRAIEGDEAAQRVLYEAHRAALYRLAYLLLDNTQDAEEVVQDTFVYALSRLVHYDPARRSLGGWRCGSGVGRARGGWRCGGVIGRARGFAAAREATGGKVVLDWTEI